MRLRGSIALLAGTLLAGDAAEFAEARRLLQHPELPSRREGLERLVVLGTGEAVQAVEDGIRHGLKGMDSLEKPFEESDAVEARLAFQLQDYLDVGGNDYALVREVRSLLQDLNLRTEGLRRQLQDHLAFVDESGAALRAFSSEEAIAKLEAGAKSEPVPILRQCYIAALGEGSRARSVPVLLGLLKANTGRVRALAAIALRPFVAAPEVAPALLAATSDKFWQVRRAAWRALADLPPEEAIPALAEGACRESGELALRIDGYLRELTGRSFADDPSRWRAWWTENEAAFREGTFEKREAEEARDSGETRTVATFFRVPVVSASIVFTIDYSASMREPMKIDDAYASRVLAEFRLPETRLGYARAELVRAIRALPEGALFNIVVFHEKSTPMASRMMKASASTKKSAIQWALRQKEGALTNLYGALRDTFRDHLSPRGTDPVFQDLPDTIVFLSDGVATAGRFRDADSLRRLVALWNASLGSVIHCVGIGKEHDAELMRSLAESTRGTYIDMNDPSNCVFAPPRGLD